jgi:quercetin dioxygenase-like cupin family protein
MRPTAAVPLLAGSLLLATAAPSAAVPNQLGGLGGMVVGAGVALGAYDYPIESGEKVTVERYTLKPGELIRWGGRPATIVVIPAQGDLVNYPTCALQYPMASGQANWLPRSRHLGDLRGVTANQSDAPIDVVAVISDVPGVAQRADQMHRESEQGPPEPDPQPAPGCPKGPAAVPVEVVRGVAGSAAQFPTIDHGQVAVYRYTLAPGASTGWHYLPDPGLLLPVKGSLVLRQDCGSGSPVRVGQARVYSADGDPQLLINQGADPAEFFLVVFNIPNPYPVVLPDAVPGPPPTDCPASAVD